MKKIISFLTVLTLVFQIGVVSISVSAASSEVANLEVSTENVFPGDAVYVTVSLTSNPGLTYIKLKVLYDPDALILFGVQNGDVIGDLTRGNSYVWSSVNTTEVTGTLATLVFSVPETASAGTYSITITCVEAGNHNADVSVNIQNGSIIVNGEECIHDMESVSYKAPTCKATGYRVLKCTECGYSETVTFPKVGCVAENNADCLNDAECKYCGDVLETAYGHKYRMQIIDPTTTEEGYTLYTCMRCNDSYEDDFLPVIKEHEHTFVEYKKVSATCQTDGYVIYKCSDMACGKNYKDDVTIAFGHSYSSSKKEPACELNGYTLHICDNCGDSYKDSYIPALGHDYVNGTCTRCYSSEFIPDAKKGDINCDGKLDWSDAELFMMYLTDWNVSINENALDLNGDGAVNNKDVMRLMKHLEGFDVKFE